jgi:hypothetical protein
LSRVAGDAVQNLALTISVQEAKGIAGPNMCRSMPCKQLAGNDDKKGFCWDPRKDDSTDDTDPNLKEQVKCGNIFTKHHFKSAHTACTTPLAKGGCQYTPSK